MNLETLNELAKNEELQNKLLIQNPHRYIYNLRDLMKVRKTRPNEYRMIATKGRHKLFDYDTGLLSVYAAVFDDYENKDHYVVQLHIGCCDDGEWEAWSKPYADKDKACQIVEKLAKLMEEWTVLPSGDEINEQIRDLGLYGE